MSPDDVRAARRAITTVFALNGVVFGSWAARIPAVRDRLELGDGELGVALAGLALGAIVAMPLGGALVARRGSAPVVRAAVPLISVAIAIVALAPSLPVLCVGTVVLGVANGSLDVTMNAHGVAVERRHGTPILGGFHAAFSAGGLAGSALGGLAAAADVDVRVHLALVGALAATTGTIITRRLLPASEDAVDHDGPVFVRPPRRLWALGALAFACLLIEGACADWSGVYLHEELDASAGFAALGFAAFSITMVLGRLFGDRLVAALGASRVVTIGGLVAAVGFAAALAISAPAAGLVGFACLGAGMAGVVPIVFRAAGDAGDDLAPGLGLAAVATTGYLGFLVGPPVVGALAELGGLADALLLVVVLALLVVLLAPAVRVSGSDAHRRYASDAD